MKNGQQSIIRGVNLYFEATQKKGKLNFTDGWFDLPSEYGWTLLILKEKSVLTKKDTIHNIPIQEIAYDLHSSRVSLFRGFKKLEEWR